MKDSFLKTLLDTHIAPVLAEHGFKRKKSTWNRRTNGIVHVVHFQVSKGHSPGEWEMFTIEVGIAVGAVSFAINGKVPSFFKEFDCITDERIGYLRPAGDRFDKWWDLKKDTDISGVARDVIHDLCTYALPTLDRVQSLHDIRELVMEVDSHMPKAKMAPGAKLWLAALCYIMGDREQYETLKDELIYGKGFKYAPAIDLWNKRMAEVAARLETDDSVKSSE